MKTIYTLAFVALLTSCISKESIKITKIPISIIGMERNIADSYLPVGTCVALNIFKSEKSVCDPLFSVTQKTLYAGKNGEIGADDVLLEEGSDYDIKSYFPTRSNNGMTVEVFHGEDLLVSTNEQLQNLNTLNNRVVLKYSHVLSQISFEVLPQSSNEELSFDSRIEVSGFYNAAIYCLEDDSIREHNGYIKEVSFFKSGLLEVEPVCFIPLGSMHKINVEVFNNGKYYEASIEKNFISGVLYHFSLTLPEEENNLSISMTLSPWQKREGEVVIGNISSICGN